MTTTITNKDINRLAIPAVIAGIAEPVISLADTAIIGRFGATALAAVGIASSFYMIVMWVLSSVRSAASSIVAQQLGRGDTKPIQELVPQAVLLAMAMGAGCLVLCNFFAEEIFATYQAKGELLEQAVAYFKIRSLGFPLTLSTFMIYGIFRGYQNTIWPMYISIAGGLLNIVFDFAFIFGVGSFIPAMGVEGAAWATLVAQGAMFLLSMYLLYTRLGVRFSLPRTLHPQLFSLAVMSFDLIIRTAALNVAYYLGNRFSTMYGTQYVAAHTIAMNLWLFAAFFLDGYATAGNALAGKLKGENNYVALYDVSKRIIRTCVGASLLVAFVFLLGYNYIGIFFTQEQQVLQAFSMIFWVVILCQPINAIAFTLDGIFKGTGDTKLLRNVLVISIAVGFLPVIYGADYLGWHIYSVWSAFLIWMLLRTGLLVYHFQQMFRVQPALAPSPAVFETFSGKTA